MSLDIVAFNALESLCAVVLIISEEEHSKTDQLHLFRLVASFDHSSKLTLTQKRQGLIYLNPHSHSQSLRHGTNGPTLCSSQFSTKPGQTSRKLTVFYLLGQAR